MHAVVPGGMGTLQCGPGAAGAVSGDEAQAALTAGDRISQDRSKQMRVLVLLLAAESRLFAQEKPEKQPAVGLLQPTVPCLFTEGGTMRGLLILFVAFAIMLAARSTRQQDIVVPRPTTPMPAINVP